MIQLTLTNTPLDQIEAQLSLITTFEDVRPLKGGAGLADWRLNGKLSHLILQSRFQGKKGEALLMPTRGRLDSKELLVLGVGAHTEVNEQELPHLLNLIVEKLLMKKSSSLSISLADLIPGMFEWRNAVRLFISMLSGREEQIAITLSEDTPYIEDAKKRNMDFSYDVKVHYELV